MNIYDTHTLLAAVEELSPTSTFLKSRYFPTNPDTDIFDTTDVLVEYKDGEKRLAPFVLPIKGGITITRSGYKTERYTPPFIAPRRSLRVDDLQKRGFGEALYSKRRPEEREILMLLNDIDELSEMISRREEQMAAETLLNNGCVMKHYADDLNTPAEEQEIRFYDGENNSAIFTPAVDWGTKGDNKLADIGAMASILTRRGLEASELLVAPDIADLLLADEGIQRLLDLRNYNLGEVNPISLPAGATRIAKLNIKGKMINVICYEETYEDEEGSTKQFISPGHIVLTAPKAGRTLYGSVTQMEESDRQLHTYPGRRVPKLVSNVDNNSRTITISSCPLLIPRNKNPWITAKVC